MATTVSKSRLDPFLECLQIPSDFSRYERLVETEIIASLEQWKQKTDACLSKLRDLAACEGPSFSVQEQAQVISTVAPYEGQGSWITETSRDISKGKYTHIGRVSCVLTCPTQRSWHLLPTLQ